MSFWVLRLIIQSSLSRMEDGFQQVVSILRPLSWGRWCSWWGFFFVRLGYLWAYYIFPYHSLLPSHWFPAKVDKLPKSHHQFQLTERAMVCCVMTPTVGQIWPRCHSQSFGSSSWGISHLASSLLFNQAKTTSGHGKLRPALRHCSVRLVQSLWAFTSNVVPGLQI